MSPSCWNLKLVSISGSSGSDSSSGSESTSPGSDSSSTCWHLCWQPPWPWRGGSSGSGSPPNSSFSLLTRLSRGPVTINTADEKAALSWPDLAWEVAGRMKQSHPKSWIPHLSGEAAALTVGCPHPLPVARKTAFNLENWSSSGKQHNFVVSVDLDWKRMI